MNQIGQNQIINLPNPSVKNIISRTLLILKINDVKSLLNDKIGSLLFNKYCQEDNIYNNILNLYNEIIIYSKLPENERSEKAHFIFNNFLIKYSISPENPFTDLSLLKIVEGLNMLNCGGTLKNEFKLQNTFFKNIEEEIYQILSPKYKSFLKSNFFALFCQWKDVELSLQPAYEDFNVLQILSKGSYSVVCLCEKTETKKQFALRCIKIKNEEMLKEIQNELNLLKEISQDKCNFIVGLNYAFSKNKHIYFILDLMEGGSLTQHIYTRGSFGSEAIVHFSSQIILALSYLHYKDIVSRDINPSNILLDKFGNAKIGSLRLAANHKTQMLTSKTGTVGFMAPEVIESNGQAYGPSVDIFSLGCLIYKLAIGQSPFSKNSNNVEKIEQQTLNCQFEIANDLPEDLKLLIKQLIVKKSEDRLKIDAIKNHVFFKLIDWNRAWENKYDSPFIPPAIKIHKPTCKVDPHMILAYNKNSNKIFNYDFKDKNLCPFGIGPRWQQEIIECGLFSNTMKTSRDLQIPQNFASPLHHRCVVEGEIFMLTNPILITWQKRNLYVYYNNLLLTQSKEEITKIEKEDETILLENISFVSNQLERHIGMNNCIFVVFKSGKRMVFTGSSLATSQQWCLELYNWWNRLNSICGSPDNYSNFNSSAKATSA